MVTNADGRDIVKIDFAEDTAHAEHILAFQIGTVAPAEHLYRQGILAGTQMLGEVEFGYVVGTLGVTYILAVEPYEGCRIDTAEVDEGAAAVPVGRQVKGTDIGTHRIDAVVLAVVVEAGTRLDERRRIGVWIFYVGIDRFVIAIHFPVGRNGEGIPVAGVEAFLEEVERTLGRFGNQVELPGAVEGQIAWVDRLCPWRSIVSLVGQHGSFVVVRHISRYGHFLVFFKLGFVFPIRRLDFGFLDGLEGKPAGRVFRVVVYRRQLVVAKCIHFALLELRSRNDLIDVRLVFYRNKVELRIVPYASGSRPLQQVFDLRVVAAIVEILTIESIFHSEGEEVNGLDVPILSAVIRIELFADNGCIVFARVTIAQYRLRLLCRTDEVGQVVVESGSCGRTNCKMRFLVLESLFLFDQYDFSLVGNASGKIGMVGRNEQIALNEPELRFVRTIVLAQLNKVALGAKRQVAHRVDDSPATGKFGNLPVDTAVLLIEVRSSHSFPRCFANEVFAFGRSVNVVEFTLLKSSLCPCSTDGQEDGQEGQDKSGLKWIVKHKWYSFEILCNENICKYTTNNLTLIQSLA
ncbi:hypothetical protein EVA_20165 [gut metagenome]|uniref:Uncharacterized protein n=1 Tax=gut metagenome TaxID=749906 RepID=J9BVY4_9ZZZZ